MELDDALEIVRQELLSAVEQHGDFASVHDGYGVLLEEVDELWDEIKKKPKNRNIDNLRKEASQIAAMAVKFMMKFC